MQGYRKQSPIRFPARAVKTELRGSWEVALAYPDDDGPLVIVDLSHIAKWELYARGLEGQLIGPAAIPRTPGQVTWSAGLTVSLCRPSVALIWQLDDGASWDLPAGTALTEVTDSTALMALIGDDAPRIFEKITDLDLTLAAKQTVRFIQGPVLDAPAQVMVVSELDSSMGVLLAVSRGSGQSVADVLLDAGAEFGLQPAGEERFKKW